MKLPPLDPVAKKHAEVFIEYFKKELEKTNGVTTFSGFMKAALYGDHVGFYTSSRDIFGSRGDFLTAPEISPLFAQSIAVQCAQILKNVTAGVIVEIGAGSGQFARDLLFALKKTQYLPKKYYIYELSPSLRVRQQAFLQEQCSEFFSLIEWVDDLDNRQVEGIIIANEVLDALPVDIFKIDNQKIKEKFIAVKDNQLCSFYDYPITLGLHTKVQALCDAYQLPDNYESEINVKLTAWIESLASILQRGILLFLDYGYERHMYYHPERSMGTLQCYYQHFKHADPLAYPGLQDITAHVDFTSVMEARVLQVAGFTTQAEFLLALGILNQAQELSAASTTDQFRQSQALKKLIFPQEMGEIIKVIALSKNFDVPLLGFTGRPVLHY